MKNLINNKYKKILLLFFLVVLTEAFLETMSVAIFVPFLQQFFGGNVKIEFLGNIFNEINLNILLAALIIFFIIKNIIIIFFAYIKIKIINSYKFYIKEKLVNLYLNANLQKFFHKKKSESIRNLMTEVDIFVSSYVAAILEIIKVFMIFIFVITFLLFYDFKTTIIVFPSLLIFVALFFYATRKKLLSLGRERAILSKVNLDKVTRLVNGIVEIKLFKIGKFYADNLIKNIKKFDNLAIPRAIIGVIPKSFIEVVLIMVFAISIFYLLEFKNFSREGVITLISIYLVAALRMFPYINGITTLYNKITLGYASYKILKEDFKTLSYQEPSISKKTNSEKIDSIEFKNVSFSYIESSENILENINLKIKNGDKIGIVGGSGSGKSTFLNILMGLLNPSNGIIKINDKIADDDVFFNLHHKVSYLTQEPYFLFDTISENIIKYNRDNNISINEINKILSKVKLNKFINNSENQKNNDFIGENGSELSGGEKQRLAIARAICKKADIMIFDEITNKLDETNEKLIMETLYEANHDKTMIIVSHNKNNLSKCDYILEIQNKSVKKVLN